MTNQSPQPDGASGYGYPPQSPVPPQPPVPPQQPGGYQQQGAYPQPGGYQQQGAYPQPGGYQQQGGYPQPGGFAQQSPQASVNVPTRKAPLFTLLAGVLAGIIGLVIVVAGSLSGFGSLVEDIGSQERLVSGQTYSITTAPNTKYGIFGDSAGSVECRAENANGSAVSVTVPFGDSYVNDRYQLAVLETGSSDTTVKIMCETSDGSDYFMGKTVGASLGGIAGAAIGGTVLMGLGFVLFLIGIIWLFVRNSQIKRARLAASHYR